MKKIYIAPELSVCEADDVVSTSLYVETEKIPFKSGLDVSTTGIGSVNDELFEI
jgi:hypothetical protein